MCIKFLACKTYGPFNSAICLSLQLVVTRTAFLILPHLFQGTLIEKLLFFFSQGMVNVTSNSGNLGKLDELVLAVKRYLI